MTEYKNYNPATGDSEDNKLFNSIVKYSIINDSNTGNYDSQTGEPNYSFRMNEEIIEIIENKTEEVGILDRIKGLFGLSEAKGKE